MTTRPDARATMTTESNPVIKPAPAIRRWRVIALIPITGGLVTLLLLYLPWLGVAALAGLCGALAYFASAHFTRNRNPSAASTPDVLNEDSALLTSEFRFHQVFHAMREGVALHELIYDSDGTPIDYIVIDVNPAFSKITGIDAERARNSLASELYGTGRAPHLEVFSTVAAGNHPTSLETFFEPMKKYLSIDAFSQAPGSFVTIFEDVTKRMEAESALRESEARYRMVFETASDAAFVLDGETGRVLEVNEAAISIYGYSREEFLDLNVNDFSAESEETSGAFKAAASGELDYVPYRVHRRKDGSTFPVEIKVSAFIAEERHLVCGFVRDISEQRQWARELEQHRENLEELVARRTSELEQRVDEVERLNAAMLNLADDLRSSNASLEATGRQLASTNQELEAFAYSVSHDLRAPLRHVGGFVELLRKNTADKLDETGRRYLDIIAESSMKLGLLIDDLLDFSRARNVEMRLVSFELGELVTEVVDELTAQEPDREIEWNVGDLPSIVADRALMRQVLVNLISNAIKFTREKDEARVEVGCRIAQEDTAECFVRDNGAGFDPKYSDKLFGVFQRLHSEEEFEGTGIGLANVRRIIERHGGQIRATGAVDQGATFTFTARLSTKR